MYAVPVQAVFRGETAQHRSASVLVAADGTVTRIRIRYSARCRQRGYRFPNTMEVVPPFTSATPDAVRERLTLHEPLAGGGHTTQTVAVDARRVSATLWRGTFSTTAILVRKHRWLDTCRLRHIAWKATRVPNGTSLRNVMARWAGPSPNSSWRRRAARGR